MTGPYKRDPGAQITFLVFQAGAGIGLQSPLSIFRARAYFIPEQ
jgi:hypothetical protein